LIKEALYPYAENLAIVTKVGAGRGEDASWFPSIDADSLRKQVDDNLKNLGVDRLFAVNFRTFGEMHRPGTESIEEPFTVLAELQRQGLIEHLGLSNVTYKQVEEARKIAPVVCVQNHYNLVHRGDDDLIDQLAKDGVAYVPFFPLGGFSPIQSSGLNDIAARVGATPMQVALAWLLNRAPNILLIPGTSSRGHLRANLAVRDLVLGEEVLQALDTVAQN
jgi:aryl-alcohol dehydrogenase-like predicted oxidoreductase